MRLLLGITCCLAAINVVTFNLYAHDKRRAQDGGWRVPERRLILLAAMGGALGAFVAMRVCHHKTRKLKFALTVTPLMVVQVLAYAAFLGMALYSLTSHGPDPEALAALESDDTVVVSEVDNGYFFDGPGSDSLFVFYPGAYVRAGAYAPLMHELAQQGMDCVALDMPYDLAFLGVGRAGGVIAEGSYESYYVGGHSLGGVAAAMYAARHEDELAGVILLAAYSTNDLSDSGLAVLSAYGSNDGILFGGSYESNRENLPADTVELVIDGGNHAQFGSYGEQHGDGEATISAAEQRSATESAILSLGHFSS